MKQIIKTIFESSDLLTENDTSLVVYDMGVVNKKLSELKSSFPTDTLHAIAIKANPLSKVLEWLANKEVGLEAASLPEVKLAENAGVPYHKIIFDSPAKTKRELEYALKKGIYINADSFQELERIDVLLKDIQSTSNIGLRINPQIGQGKIESTSVSGKISKFGVPIENNEDFIIQKYLQYEWLNGIHVHIGSQGYSINCMVRGIKKVADLFKKISQALGKNKLPSRLEYFDLGGGLSVKYHEDDPNVSMADYVNLLRTEIPTLFSGKYKLITEFGRYIHAKAAIALSRVEYVKIEKNSKIIINHLGADFLIRKCYNPNDWYHKITVLDSRGNPKSEANTYSYHIAGPLCFSGDFIATNIQLPEVEENDVLVINDVGAYTLSMWSRYNSRQHPKVVAMDEEQDSIGVLRPRDQIQFISDYWK